MTTFVPNRPPLLSPPPNQRIALIGQSPGEQEITQGLPFVGRSGELLRALFSKTGIVWDRCFIGNVCQSRPPGGDFANLDWAGDDVQKGIAQLTADLAAFKPTLIVCFGNEALHLFKAGNIAPPTRKEKLRRIPVWPNSITNWRGSIFAGHELSPAPGVKCVATYHPAAVLREFDLQPYVKFDVQRIASEAKFAGLDLPTRLVRIARSPTEAIQILRDLRAAGDPLAFDIEGGCHAVSCFSLANSAFGAFVIPFMRVDGSSVWTVEEEIEIWQAARDLLEDESVPKVLQNGLYDQFVLAWTFGILVRGVQDDTMLKWYELFAELEKSLATQTSILTRQPFYKMDRKSADDEVAWRYCGLDSCVTFECNERMDEMMGPASGDGSVPPHLLPAPTQRDHYQFNLSLVPAVLYMELRGMQWEKQAAKDALAEVEAKIAEIQALVDLEAAKKPGPLNDLLRAIEQHDEAAMVALVRPRLCVKKPMETYEERKTKTYKNGKTRETVKKKRRPAEIKTLADCELYALPSEKQACSQLVKGFRSSRSESLRSFSDACRLLGISLNLSSTQFEGDAQAFLKNICGLPAVFKRVKGRITDTETTGQDALVELYAKTQDVRVLWMLQMRRLKKQASDLATAVDPDGRIRCSYQLVKETGRLSASKSPTGNGANLQAWAKKLRHLITADPGCWFAQCDLEGADSWTVAAECAALGDTTMLDDLKAGLKPAKVLMLLARDGQIVNELPRDEIKQRLKAMTIEDWRYAGYKSACHGSAYGMGIPTMIRTVLKNSLKTLPDELSDAKPIVFSQPEMRAIQGAFFSRYKGVKSWHEKVERMLLSTGELVTVCGHRRRFYGRKQERKGAVMRANHKTLGDALASLPQFYTTYATKVAIWRHWHDLEIRRADGSLRIEPCHTVHDSKIDRFADSEREWACAKIKQYFDNEIKIAGIPVKIPIDGTVGRDWGMDEANKL